MAQWSVKYTRSRAKYWTLWDRNLKQESFTGKILWKPTEVCPLWYSHATERTCGGEGVSSGLPKLHIFWCSVTDALCFLPEKVRAPCSQIKCYPSKSWNKLRASAATKDLQVTARKLDLLFCFLYLCSSFVIQVKQCDLNTASYIYKFDWHLEFYWREKRILEVLHLCDCPRNTIDC